MPEQKIIVDAILFDMDGTLIDSTPGVLKAWELFCKDYSLGDSETIAHETHGRRLYDTLKEYCKIDEGREAPCKCTAEIDRFEDEVILGGPVALPGTLELLNRVPSNKYTPGALNKAGLPIPKIGYVTSNDVSKGKPFPDPYLAGALKCGVDAKNCLVVEDAVSGLTAGRAAGAKVLAVCTSTPKERLLAGAQPGLYCPRLAKV
ncbi:HAD-like domain-containing protein [Ephemerocybe angulata]|uniref:HAD-like domain-containing protein n=1 Tax=Ephemerocybe angulata TaxID=980116 RepID=A0A8H6IKX8_9AGAR|nr:HAD-like domain-containing protein [Tulosesus angulatus]